MERWVLVLLVLASCAGSPEPDSLELLSFRQEGQTGVFLNETLVFHFSAEVDQASVTGQSFRIHGPEGRRARGRIEVQGSKLLFHPELPRAADLSDGGFVPDGLYHVELAGFPRPDGLRGRRREVLERTVHASFSTVRRASGSRPFLDPSPGVSRLWLSVREDERQIGPLDPIRFRCEEAVDPTTVRSEQFKLYRSTKRDAGTGGEGPQLDALACEVRLVRNDRDGALLEMRPVGESEELVPALEPGEYFLLIDPRDFDLKALGGGPIRFVHGVQPFPIFVAGPRIGLWREEFLDPAGRSPEPVPETDGTALWDGSGKVRARFPLAAGDGQDGTLELTGEIEEKDLHAFRLRVPEGETCELTGPGLVVLRSQGRLAIEGRLTRRVEPAPHGWSEQESWEEWSRRTDQLPPSAWTVPSMAGGVRGPRGSEPDTALSAWLAEAAARDEAWTVLISGADLVVSEQAAIHTDGQVLLVAGGWVRVLGELGTRDAWDLGEGGQSLGRRSEHIANRLFIDEPGGENPLAGTIRLGTLSAPILPPKGVTRWRSARHGGAPGQGSYSVLFRGVRYGPPRTLLLFGPVQDPALLEGCQALSLLVRLELHPGETWDPPTLDWVELTWSESP
jgi:hypothetical protein